MAERLMDSIKRVGECMPGGFFVYIADEREEMIYVNDVVLDMFGCADIDEFKELTGYTFQGIVYPEDLDAIQNSIKVQVGHNEKRLDYVEYRIETKQGDIRWVDDYGRLVNTEEYGEVYFVLIRDITELKKQEADKLEIEKSLEKEKHLNDIRKDFLFHVSQDIKKPMDMIGQYSSLALSSTDEPDKIKEYINGIAKANAQMITVSENLLDMNLIDSGKIRITETPVDIRHVIHDACGVFHEAAMEKKIEIKERISIRKPGVYLDEMNFRKIIYNILSNAVKFTENEGTITISAKDGRTSESGYARYEIEISDTGIGMEREYLGRLYDAFSTENIEDEMSGIGIGLSVTKKLLDAFGGTISVKSIKGEGTTFSIGIALRLADREISQNRRMMAVKKGRDEKQRLLLAEDVEINRELAKDILMRAGYEVDVVTDGSDAVRSFENHPESYYGLILMDVHMPVMNGNEAARRIRSLDRADAKTIPIIALSKNARSEEKRESIASGMNSHIDKPFDMTNLIDTINIYLRKR
ncbi:MAG: response regulator [Eubacterium sp.]|nr:response regulator [Eubacterium sp.]